MKTKAKLTAQYASAVRALGCREKDIVSPDYLARFLISWPLKIITSFLFRKITIAFLYKMFPNLYSFHLVRTIYIDSIVSRLLGENKIEQVLILGAGFDTRALRLNHEGKAFYELDFPETQKLKLNRLKSVPQHYKNSSSSIVYVPIDFKSQAPFEELQKYMFDNTRKTLVIWEGVTMYLSEQVVQDVLKDIAINLPGKSYLVFDYLIPENIESNNKQGNNFVQNINEEYIFGITPSELETFVKQFGYTVLENNTYDILNQKYLKDVTSKYLRNDLDKKTSPALAFLQIS